MRPVRPTAILVRATTPEAAFPVVRAADARRRIPH